MAYLKKGMPMSTTKRLWIALGLLLTSGFAVLLWMGGEIHRQQPPIPEQIVTESGQVIFTRADIETGRTVWQSIGGQQLGSIWGHGALVAPDWSADWLHREAVAWLSLRAQQHLRAADLSHRRRQQSQFQALGRRGDEEGQ